MKTTYSHAAPYIRARLIESVRAANVAGTIRERQRRFAEAGAFALALKIMAASEDQTPVVGIADPLSLGIGIKEARDWLGLDADKILGPMTGLDAITTRREGAEGNDGPEDDGNEGWPPPSYGPSL